MQINVQMFAEESIYIRTTVTISLALKIHEQRSIRIGTFCKPRSHAIEIKIRKLLDVFMHREDRLVFKSVRCFEFLSKNYTATKWQSMSILESLDPPYTPLWMKRV